MLRGLRARLRPGGVVAFQEGDLRRPPPPYPPGAVHELVARWTTPPPGAPGPDVAMGPKLFQTFLQAGLPAPQLRHDLLLGGGPRWRGYAYLAATVESLLPFLVQAGAVSAEEVDVSSLEDRLRPRWRGWRG